MLEIKMCDHSHKPWIFVLTTKRRSHEIDKRSPVLVKPSQVRNYIVPVYPPPPPPQKKKKKYIYIYRQGQRQGVCLGGGGKIAKKMSRCASHTIFRQPWKVAQQGGTGGGGGGNPTHISPRLQKISHTHFVMEYRTGIMAMTDWDDKQKKPKKNRGQLPPCPPPPLAPPLYTGPCRDQ